MTIELTPQFAAFLPRRSAFCLLAGVGCISGGPLIGWFETKHHVTHYCLSGIVSQSHAGLENVVAKRADFVQADGRIREAAV